LVDASSARLDVVQNPIALARPHILMNKFGGPKDPGYTSVAAKVGLMVRNMHIKSPVAQADAVIRQECYNSERLRIQRLSGQLLEMDSCYINLSTVEKPERGTIRENSHLGSGVVHDSDEVAEPFSLAARLKIERPSEATEVQLATLFDVRMRQDGEENRPRRVLIQGRAGIGKTTLCKKIVHDFIHGKMWYGLYDRILWVPLRNLKQPDRRKPGYNLGDLLLHEFLHVPHQERLARALWQEIKGNTDMKTLFLLDGLDEVTSDLEGDLEKFLGTLLNEPNVILTSRPHATLPHTTNAFDIELETIGFYPEQVDEYITVSFPAEAGSDSKTATTIREFLQSHQLVQNLVRIPVQLDALCYTWDEISSGAPPQTMTGLYQALAENLWKKDAVRLGRIAESRAKDVRWNFVKSEMKKEIEFLEAISFAGLCTETIDFNADFRDRVIDGLNKQGNSVADDMLPRLSFLRTSDSSAPIEDRQYHFIHLTFQEFFAARCFTRKWRANEQLEYYDIRSEQNGIFPMTFLQEHKYEARYNVFWRFVAGVMDSDEETCTINFFETMDEQPRDILGPAHHRLVMPCLSEVIFSRNSPRISALESKLENELARLMIAEWELTGASSIASEDGTSERSLEAVFRLQCIPAWPKILSGISRRTTISQNIIDLSLACLRQDSSESTLISILELWQRATGLVSSEMLEGVAVRLGDDDWDVRRAVVDVLESQTHLPQQVLEDVAARLGDDHWYVHRAAVDVLKSQTQLPQQILEGVAARLGDVHSDVRQAAVDVLKSQTQLPQQMLEGVVARLGDNHSDVRQAALNVLKSQMQLPQEMLEGVAARLGDDHSDVRQAAVDVLESQTQLPHQVLEGVAARLGDGHWYVRRAVVDVLKGQTQLPQQILEGVAARLGDVHSDVRQAALDVFKSQTQLPQQILDVVAARLGDVHSDVRQAALDVLKGQTQLPQQILEGVVARLDDDHSGVRRAAVDVLESWTQLPQQILEVVAARLGDVHSDVRQAALDVFKSQTQLPQQMLEGVAARLGDDHWCLRQAALDVLKGQTQLPQQMLEGVVARLDDDHSDVRRAAVDVLNNQTQLPQQVLVGVAARLGDDHSDVQEAAVHALKRQSQLHQQSLVHYVNFFVSNILRQSFSGNVYWLVQDNISTLTVESRTIDIQGDNGELMIFSQAVGEILANSHALQ
jgi:NACHT/LRR/PYD domain-containing protein 3